MLSPESYTRHRKPRSGTDTVHRTGYTCEWSFVCTNHKRCYERGCVHKKNGNVRKVLFLAIFAIHIVQIVSDRVGVHLISLFCVS